MTTLYLTEQRSTVTLDGETLLIKIPYDRETDRAARKVRLPLIKVSGVIVYGNITLTTPAMAALLERQIDVCFLTRFGKFVGHVNGQTHRHGRLRLEQVRAHDDPSAALHVARVCVRSKLHNQRTQLLRGNRTRQSDTVAQTADAISDMIDRVDALPDCDHTPPDPSRPQIGTVLGQLIGLEGQGAAAYFKGFAALLAEPWEFPGRHRRPPTDPVNALLSYGYTILTNQAIAASQIVGFDPYIGYLHSTQYGKPALALDIIEAFRTPVVDSVVLTVLNNRILTPDDFEETLGAWKLSDRGRKAFLQKYEERMETTIRHPIFKYHASYRRCLELQMRLLSRWLLGELATFRGFHIR